MTTRPQRNTSSIIAEDEDGLADDGPIHFSDVSFSSNMLYWTRLLETSYNRAFLAEIPVSTSVSVWRVLAWLSEKEYLTVGELSLHTHMERTVLGRLLDRMAGQGLIARMPGEGDRRIRVTHILPKGRRTFAKMQPVRDAIYDQAVRGIDPAEVEMAHSVIIKMVKNLNMSDASADPAVQLSPAKAADTTVTAAQSPRRAPNKRATRR